MLLVAVAQRNMILEGITRSFPAKVLVVAEELIADLIRAGKVDVAIVPKTQLNERRFAHRIVETLQDGLLVSTASLSSHKQLLLEDFILRLATISNAENKYLLRMVASVGDADRLLQLLRNAYLTDVFVVKNDTLARFETVTDNAAFYDILAKLREAGARQISLIPIEKYY